MLRVVAVCVVVMVLAMETQAQTPEQAESQPGCRHWCKKPGGPPKSFYCCDRGNNNEGEFAIHDGKCPRRDTCPESSIRAYRPITPRVCAHDGQCNRNEKCCADACLEHHTCLLADK